MSGPLQVTLVTRSFIVNKGNFLLVKRVLTDSYKPGQWECSGGKVNEGENLEQARAREILQETGLVTVPASRLAYNDDQGVTHGTLSIVVFNIVRIMGGALRLSEEHDDAAWVVYRGMKSFDITPETARAAKALRRYFK